MVELLFAEQTVGPVLCAGSQANGPAKRRHVNASPDFVVSGQYIARQCGLRLGRAVADVVPLRARRNRCSDENKTPGDEIAT